MRIFLFYSNVLLCDTDNEKRVEWVINDAWAIVAYIWACWRTLTVVPSN